MLVSINRELGWGWVLDRYLFRIPEEFGGALYGAEFGAAYGGTVATAASAWRGRGTIWGFDTFNGHPGHLVHAALPARDNEANTMNTHYAKHGTEGLSVDYQRAELARMELPNAILVPGLIHADSCRAAGVPKLHYAHLDLDILESMETAYANVLPLLVPGGYLILHDVYNFPRLRDWLRNQIIPGGLWGIDLESPVTLYCVLKRKA